MSTQIPDFTQLDFQCPENRESRAEWEQRVQAETGRPLNKLLWETMEQIPVEPIYTEKALDPLEHLDYVAGMPPYLRGPYATMYAMRPWTVRQYAGFSTAEESNAFYRRNLAAGQ